MPQTFHPAFNTISRVSIFGAVFIVSAAFGVLYAFYRSPYSTEENVAQTQPVPFSHQHHVADIGIDCRYCHTSVEKSSFANVPPTATCMNCHSQLFTEEPILAPVRQSYDDEKPLRWTRVHDLPDYAYFDHSIHLDKGIGCVSCHGEVDRMPLMWRENTLHMDWCLGCHRDPGQHVRPREFLYTMQSREELSESDEFQAYLKREFPDVAEGDRAGDLDAISGALLEKYGVSQEQPQTHCSVCHR
jgi:MoCo/4Fe-4S cofactor protein with predicted Tat translocation signal